MVNIESVEMADCQIRKITKSENEILIHFSEIYNLEKRKYVSDVTLILRNWTSFINKLYKTDKPLSNGKEQVLSKEEFEILDEISRKTIDGNKLTLEGFSKNSRHWMTYEFIDFEYEILHEDINSKLK